MHPVNTMSNQLLSALTTWMEQHPALDNARIPTVAYITMDIAGRESETVQEGLFKIVMWIFGVDDLYDSNEFNLIQLQAITSLLLKDEPLDAALQLSGAQLAIVNDLRETIHALLSASALGLSGHEPYYRYLQDMKNQGINAMLVEATAKNAAADPDIDAYLENGRMSVTNSLVFTFLFHLMEPHFFAATDTALLDGLLTIAAEIVRLVNDKATYKRELLEHKLNSVTIIQKRSGCSIQEAVQQVTDMIAARMLQLQQLVSSYQEPTLQRFGHFMIHVCEAEQRFYATGDFR
jgi:hypothetical protein